MRLRRLIVTGVVLYIVYKAGVIKGHYECMNNLNDKVKGDATIFDENGEFVDKISKNTSFIIRKKNA